MVDNRGGANGIFATESVAMSGAGLPGGMIFPSRDILVRAAAPPGPTAARSAS